MSHGIPCIISDSNAGMDYIRNEIDGVLFKSEDIQDLINKILYAENSDNWAKICLQLRNSFDSQAYSVSSHVDNLINVYNEIMKQ